MIIFKTWINSYGDILFERYFLSKEKMLVFHKTINNEMKQPDRKWEEEEIDIND